MLEALKRGDFYSSQGPQIHDIAVAGDEVTVACSPAAWILAVGAGTGSRSANGQDLTRATLPLDCFGEDGYFRITVTDDKGRQAWSNPIGGVDDDGVPGSDNSPVGAGTVDRDDLVMFTAPKLPASTHLITPPRVLAV